MDSQFTIVIADDHPLFRGALYQAVHMAIDEARLLEADSIDSLTHLLAEHPEVDLLLLDPPYGTGAAGVALDRLLRLGWIAPGTWVAAETSAKETLEVRGLEIDADRKVGKARLWLLRLAED